MRSCHGSLLPPTALTAPRSPRALHFFLGFLPRRQLDRPGDMFFHFSQLDGITAEELKVRRRGEGGGPTPQFDHGEWGLPVQLTLCMDRPSSQCHAASRQHRTRKGFG